MYSESVAPALIFASDTATFTEYLTPNDALAAALLLDPSYDPDIILGPLYLTPVNISAGEQTVDLGVTVTLNSEYTCSDPAATLTYSWKDPDGNVIAGATSDSYTTPGITEFTNGVYTSVAVATNSAGQTSYDYVNNFSVNPTLPRGQFTLTRSGNNLTNGLFSFLSGFSASSATIEVPSSSLTISYDPVDGFKTTGSPLLAVDQAAELFVNGSYVKSFTIHPVDGMFTYNLN